MADNEWFKHDGGECPLVEGTLIDVKYRDGTVKYGLAALDEDIDGDYGTDYHWKLSMADNDIVNWRLNKPEQSLDDALGSDTISADAFQYPQTSFKPSSEAQLRSDEAARINALLSEKLITISDIASKLTRKNLSVADIKLVKDLLESVEEYEENR